MSRRTYPHGVYDLDLEGMDSLDVTASFSEGTCTNVRVKTRDGQDITGDVALLCGYGKYRDGMESLCDLAAEKIH